MTAPGQSRTRLEGPPSGVRTVPRARHASRPVGGVLWCHDPHRLPHRSRRPHTRVELPPPSPRNSGCGPGARRRRSPARCWSGGGRRGNHHLCAGGVRAARRSRDGTHGERSLPCRIHLHPRRRGPWTSGGDGRRRRTGSGGRGGRGRARRAARSDRPRRGYGGSRFYRCSRYGRRSRSAGESGIAGTRRCDRAPGRARPTRRSRDARRAGASGRCGHGSRLDRCRRPHRLHRERHAHPRRRGPPRWHLRTPCVRLRR